MLFDIPQLPTPNAEFDPRAKKIPDRVKVALALHQQAQVAAQDIAVGHTTDHRQRRIDALEHGPQWLQQMPHQRQTGHRREVVVELLDDQLAQL